MMTTTTEYLEKKAQYVMEIKEALYRYKGADAEKITELVLGVLDRINDSRLPISLQEARLAMVRRIVFEVTKEALDSKSIVGVSKEIISQTKGAWNEVPSIFKRWTVFEYLEASYWLDRANARLVVTRDLLILMEG